MATSTFMSTDVPKFAIKITRLDDDDNAPDPEYDGEDMIFINGETINFVCDGNEIHCIGMQIYSTQNTQNVKGDLKFVDRVGQNLDHFNENVECQFIAGDDNLCSASVAPYCSCSMQNEIITIFIYDAEIIIEEEEEEEEEYVKTELQKQCWFGSQCNAENCPYIHPTVECRDSTKCYTKECRYGAKCHTKGCRFSHPAKKPVNCQHDTQQSTFVQQPYHQQYQVANGFPQQPYPVATGFYQQPYPVANGYPQQQFHQPQYPCVNGYPQQQFHQPQYPGVNGYPQQQFHQPQYPGVNGYPLPQQQFHQQPYPGAQPQQQYNQQQYNQQQYHQQQYNQQQYHQQQSLPKHSRGGRRQH